MATRRPKTLDFWQGHLPHWQVDEGRYFVTIHLNGAIPQIAHQRIRDLSEQFRTLKQNNIEGNSDNHLKLSRRIFFEMERWLDCKPPVSHFCNPKLCEMTVEAIEYRHRARIWDMFSFVIMPSHVHLFFELNNELSLKRELEEFKRWTGHQASKINSTLAADRFWQLEWFDHWSRSHDEDDKIIRYIQSNPVKAGLASDIGQYSYFK